MPRDSSLFASRENLTPNPSPEERGTSSVSINNDSNLA
jgi:hypothetical protein